MSFQKPYTIVKNSNNRKEIDSLLAMHVPLIIHKQKERTSAFTSKGSLTLEAALVVPIFFFAMLCMVYLLEAMSIQTMMRNALYSVGKEVAQQAYGMPVLLPSDIEKWIVENIGTEKLEESILADGASGLDCKKTHIEHRTAVMDLSVCYQLEIPVLMFRIPAVSCEETLRVKGWTGYTNGLYIDTGSEMVYVTDYGIVYHKDKNCTYLELAIQSVSTKDVKDLRNASGAKYYPCEKCGKQATETGQVYITTYGTRYHSSLDCNKIKRTVHEVPLDEVYGLGGCSKCVK